MNEIHFGNSNWLKAVSINLPLVSQYISMYVNVYHDYTVARTVNGSLIVMWRVTMCGVTGMNATCDHLRLILVLVKYLPFSDSHRLLFSLRIN